MVDKEKIRSDIKSLVENDELSEALEALELLAGSRNKEVPSLKGRLSRTRIAYRQGKIQYTESDMLLNQISLAIMELTYEL